ncbi:MAG: hypothetical protein J3K34DRAFT_190431 [Monoraphidium minutum]|nr:MAG: hypothetical protein J3K34DRAFT_190431 [Monoraphidium minutum]
MAVMLWHDVTFYLSIIGFQVLHFPTASTRLPAAAAGLSTLLFGQLQKAMASAKRPPSTKQGQMTGRLGPWQARASSSPPFKKEGRQRVRRKRPWAWGQPGPAGPYTWVQPLGPGVLGILQGYAPRDEMRPQKGLCSLGSWRRSRRGARRKHICGPNETCVAPAGSAVCVLQCCWRFASGS